MENSVLEKAECLGVVEKMSNRGFSFNKRFLCLSEGVLSYYSKPPPNAEDEGFTVGMLKALGLKPKLAIEVKHIQSIRPAEKALMDKKKKKFMFIIEFKKSLMYKPTDNSPSKSKKDDEDIEYEWKFAVQNQENYDKWVSLLVEAKAIEALGPQPIRIEEPKVILRLQSTMDESKLEQIVFPGQKEEYDKGLELALTPSKLRKPPKIREELNSRQRDMDQEQEQDYEYEEETGPYEEDGEEEEEGYQQEGNYQDKYEQQEEYGQSGQSGQYGQEAYNQYNQYNQNNSQSGYYQEQPYGQEEYGQRSYEQEREVKEEGKEAPRRMLEDKLLMRSEDPSFLKEETSGFEPRGINESSREIRGANESSREIRGVNESMREVRGPNESIREIRSIREVREGNELERQVKTMPAVGAREVREVKEDRLTVPKEKGIQQQSPIRRKAAGEMKKVITVSKAAGKLVANKQQKLVKTSPGSPVRSPARQETSKGPGDWENKMNMLINEAFKVSGSGEKLVETEFKILRLVGDFRTRAVDVCKSIIEQLALAPAEQTHGFMEKSEKSSSGAMEKIFVSEEMKIKITWSQKETVNVPGLEGSSVYTEKLAKSYNHEFRSMSVLNDTVHTFNKKRKELVYRVPLAAVVTYKGFKCLVTSMPPLNKKEDTLILGPCTSDGSYRVNRIIEGDLRQIAKSLNLKEHRYIHRDQVTSVNILLNIFTEVHANSSGTRGAAPEYKYFTKTGDLFPVDIDVEADHNTNFQKLLRPEFLLEYERPLSADALLDTVEHFDNEEDDIEVAEAAILLRDTVIPALIGKLESLEIIVSDSQAITQAFHSHGINMRYLGLVCQQATLPHVKEMCKIEMIARSVKKILRKKLSDFTLHKTLEEGHLERHVLYNKKKTALIDLIDRFSLIRQEEDQNNNEAKNSENETADIVIDFLNLIFGESAQSQEFWDNILTTQIAYDYAYEFDPVHKAQVSLGGLLHAVIYHCNINLLFNQSMTDVLGKVAHPFIRDQFIGLEAHSKVYAMCGLDVKPLSEKYKQTRLTKQYEPAIKSCLLALNFSTQISYQHTSPYDPTLLGDMAEILFDSGDLEKAFLQAQEGLKHSRPCHSEALKCLCVMLRISLVKGEQENASKTFERAVSALNFHVGMYHPLHVTIYNIMGYYNAEKGRLDVALFLYKTSLACCMKVLGQTHSLTGSVYLDLGSLSVEMREGEAALGYFDKALCVFEAAKGVMSPECAHARYLIASTSVSLNKVQEASESVKVAIEIYETNRDGHYDELVECYLLVCRIGELKDDVQLSLEHANKAWPMLNKISSLGKSVGYKARIVQINFDVVVQGLTAIKKNILYEVFEGVVETLEREHKLSEIAGTEKEVSIRAHCMKELLQNCNTCKNIQHTIGNSIRVVLDEMEAKDCKAFFANYRSYMENLDDFRFKECLEDFEKVIFICGVEAMRNSLTRF